MEQKYKPYIMYKITCNDNENLIYIGSTTNFKVRKSLHKGCCDNGKSKKYNFKIYQSIRNNFGWNNFTIKPIEMFYADSKIKAKIRENELMEVFNSNLNSVRAYRNEEEKQEYVKEYYKNNIDIYKKNSLMYRENNKDKIKEYHKQYDDDHKNEKKEYYEKNKEKINMKIICKCGCEIQKRGLNEHLTSKKHLKLILNSL